MFVSSHSSVYQGRVSGLSAAFALVFAILPFSGFAAPAADDIEIVTTRGEVEVSMDGVAFAAKAGSTLDLPAELRTGHDGSADLRQGPTTIGVGPDTKLSFPAPAERGAAVDRIVQPLGNAFYSVGARGKDRLRVETPYLVAVIKGTQFNVVVDEESSTISLFEGSLEVLATDGDAMVHLSAGEIAIRRRGDKAITVLRMKDQTVALTGGIGTNGDGLASDAGTSIDAGPVGVDAGVDAGIDAVSGTVDAGVDAGVDLGPVDADLAVVAALDAAAGTIDAGVDAGVDLGLADVDLAADAGVDAAAGTIDAGVDAGADLGLADIDLAADAGVDAAAGAVDLGLDPDVDFPGTDLDLDVDLGLGLDLGLGGGTSDPPASSEDQDSGDGLGGLLGGLLGQPRP